MNFAVLTIFPEMFHAFWNHGIIRRAIDGRHITATTINIRDFAAGRHRVTDDRPYGGGCGMVMKPEPLAGAIGAAREQLPGALIVHLTPQGRQLDQSLASQLATLPGMVFICGRYEGVDARIGDHYVDLELSIGDYVMTGGELGAMVVVDTVTRLIPGVLGGAKSADRDSFSDRLLEHDHYTRPPEFEGATVPGVLLSGHHGEIEAWRQEKSLIQTLLKRPDLLNQRDLTAVERQILAGWQDTLQSILARDTDRK